MTSLKAPHIEEPLIGYSAIVKNARGETDMVTVFAASPAGASQIVHFFLPERMLVRLCDNDAASLQTVILPYGVNDNRPHSTLNCNHLKGDCLDPVGAAMLEGVQKMNVQLSGNVVPIR